MKTCRDCGGKATGWYTKRCRSCYGKLQAKRQQGSNNHNYKHGRTLKHKCVDCGAPVYYVSTRCNKCAGVYRSKTVKVKDKPKGYYKGYAKKWSKCTDCGCEIWEGNTRCKSCNIIWQVAENSPTWMGGVSKEPYGKQWNNQLREKVRKRDNYKCQECGVPQQECATKLDVHHIDYDKTNNAITNLISLCHACHTALCMRPEWAIKRYQEITQC